MDLCAQFQLRPNDRRCQPCATVYAPDFFGVITKAYKPHDGVQSTYDDVQAKLAKYQWRYEPPVTTGDGLTYFVAAYDLQGDRVFPITMFFYANGKVFRIVADVGD